MAIGGMAVEKMRGRKGYEEMGDAAVSRGRSTSGMAITVIAEIPPEQRAMGNGPVPELQAPLHDDECNLG